MDTAWLCYTQLTGYTSVQWVPITLVAVHVVMYWYYFLAARGIRFGGKNGLPDFKLFNLLLI